MKGTDKMSEVQFSFDALSFLQEVLPEQEETTPTESIISRPTEPKPVEAKDENQTMLQDFARLQADQYDLKSMKKAPPVKSTFIQDYLDSLDMFYKDEQMNEAINSALMEANRPPIGQMSETARTAMFSGADMQGSELTMMDNAREAQDVVQPMVTPVFRGRQPEMADSPAPVDAPSIDVRSNEMLDKPKGIMTDPRGNKRPKARPEGLEPVGFKVPEYKVYNSPDEMSELEILARTIEEEARGEDYIGKLAVGATIANRAASGSYGKDIRGVILREGQFSPWNSWTGYAKGEQGKDMMRTRASEDSYKAASAILQGSYEDPTDGAIHYVNEKVSKPYWLSKMKGRKRGTLTIGNHLFGNADSNKKYDGKSYIFDRKSETTDQPVEAAPTTVKAIQRIIGTVADGNFGPASRKKAREFLGNKGIDIAKSATDEDLMKLIVSS